MTSTDPAGPPLRPTRQRLAVVEALASFDDFRSAQEIHELLGRARRERRAGHRLPHPAGARRRRRGRHAAHRGRRGDLPALLATPTTTTWSAAAAARPSRSRARPSSAGPGAIAAEHGYADVSHTLEIFGTCAVLPLRSVTARTRSSVIDSNRARVCSTDPWRQPGTDLAVHHHQQAVDVDRPHVQHLPGIAHRVGADRRGLAPDDDVLVRRAQARHRHPQVRGGMSEDARQAWPLLQHDTRHPGDLPGRAERVLRQGGPGRCLGPHPVRGRGLAS